MKGKLPPLPKRKGLCQDCGAAVAGPKHGAIPKRCKQCLHRYWYAERTKRPPPYEKTCAQCGIAFKTHQKSAKFCSMECSFLSLHERGKKFTCRECGREFRPKRSGQYTFCSRPCNFAYKAANPKVRQKFAAVGGGQPSRWVETVRPLEVFQRDGWRCQHCGICTPKRLRGTTDPRAPELDHLEPLALGGEHSYRNTCCSCRACNGKKGAMALGQLRLFG